MSIAGFAVERIVAGDVPLPQKNYADPQQRIGFLREVSRRLESPPSSPACACGR